MPKAEFTLSSCICCTGKGSPKGRRRLAEELGGTNGSHAIPWGSKNPGAGWRGDRSLEFQHATVILVRAHPQAHVDPAANGE